MKWIAVFSLLLGQVSASMEKESEILDFWFGKLEKFDSWHPSQAKKWFFQSDAFDQEIRDKFFSDLENVDEKDWTKSPRGRLALIILLDQFSRNLYRNDAKAFSNDERALKLVLEGMERGDPENLYYIEKQFFFMPLMHSEDPAIQELSLKTFQKLHNEAPENLKGYFSGVLNAAQSHYDTIQKFGRYPYRNAALQRESTEEEKIYLENRRNRK